MKKQLSISLLLLLMTTVALLAACGTPRQQELPLAEQGEVAPDFQLSDSQGETVQLSKALERGPVVLVFYRGHW